MAFGLNELGLACASSIYRLWQGGNQWSGVDTLLSFLRHIAQLPLDYSKWQHWESASIHGGPRVMHENFCMVSDRPETLRVDEQNRPHCDDGPFCRWRDGSALYAWHGVRTPAWIIEHPELITPAKIEAESNAEVRCVEMEKYGLYRYLQDSGAQEIHRDEFGVLYRKADWLLGDMMVVEVANSTPESDGSFRKYVLRVNRDLRPMRLENGRYVYGEPQALTARNAVASTFGMRGEDYNPIFQS